MIIIFAIFLTSVLALQEKYIHLLLDEEKQGLLTTNIKISTSRTTDSQTQAPTINALPKNNITKNESKDIYLVKSVTTTQKSSEDNENTYVSRVPTDKSATDLIANTRTHEIADMSTALDSKIFTIMTKNTAEVNTATTENYSAVTAKGSPKKHNNITTFKPDLKPGNIEEAMNLPKYQSAALGRARKKLRGKRKHQGNAHLIDNEPNRGHLHKKQKVTSDPSREIEEEEEYVELTTVRINMTRERTTMERYRGRGIKKYLHKKKLPSHLTSAEMREYLYALYGGKEFYENVKNSMNNKGIWNIKSVVRNQESIEDQPYFAPKYKYSPNLPNYNLQNYLKPNEVKKKSTKSVNSPRGRQIDFRGRIKERTSRTTHRYKDAIDKKKRKVTHRYRPPKEMTTQYPRKERTIEIPIVEEEEDQKEVTPSLSSVEMTQETTSTTTEVAFVRPFIEAPTVKTPTVKEAMAQEFYLPDSHEPLYPRNSMTRNRYKSYFGAIKDILARNNRRPYIDSRERDNYILSLYASKNKKVKLKKRPKLNFLKKYGLRTNSDNSKVIFSDGFGRKKPKRGKHIRLIRIFKDLNRLQYLMKSDEEIIGSSNEAINIETHKDTKEILNDNENNILNTIAKIHYEKNNNDLHTNVQKFRDTMRIQSRNQNKVLIYMNVLKDLMLDDSNALKQYDWLITTLQIQAVLSKSLKLIKRTRQLEPIHSDDLQILRYIAFLHKLSLEIQEENQLDNRLTKRVKVLSRNKKKRKNKLLKKKGLINRIWLYLRTLLQDLVKEDDFSHLYEFLINVQDKLYDLHEAIRHIADVTKFDSQNWYGNLKQLYLSSDKKHLRELLLHISLSRLVDLVEHSCKQGLNYNFLQFLQTHKIEANRIVEEMLFIDKIVNEIKINMK